MEILVFGNPLIERDNLALKIMPKLQRQFPQFRFKEFDSTEDLHKQGRNLKIIDVAEGLDKTRLMSFPPNSLEQLQTNRVYSMHDFDLAYNLKLLKKMNMLDKVQVLAIPNNLSEKEALDQSQLILRKWVAQLMQGS